MSDLQGLKELSAKLESVKHEIAFKGGRFALRKSANVIAKKVEKNVARLNDPKTAEDIAKNISVRWSPKRFKSTGDLMFRVGVLGGAAQKQTRAAEYSRTKRRKKGTSTLASLGELSGKGKSNPGGDTFYWRFLEFGTKNAPAKPFLRRSLEEGKGEAEREFIKQANASINRAIKKAGG